MWKRDEAPKPTAPAAPAPAAHQPVSTASVPQPESRRIERDVVNIGKSVVIKGELNGSEDLTIEGHVEGKIELKDHVLTIGPNGRIKAQVLAKSVIVLGEVNGNVTATEKVDIRDGGSVDGDIISPRVAIAEGAHHVAFTKDWRYAFVQNALLNLPGMSDGSITVVDLKEEKVIGSVDTLKNKGYNPNSIVLLPKWNHLAGH